jgi:hypothetical protein
MVYHVLNRGNDRKPIFHKRGDARAFPDFSPRPNSKCRCGFWPAA